jgi:WhiB family redox-sensing transcriptional regulator
MSVLVLPWITLGDWVEEALCAQVSPEFFFPEKGEGDLVRVARQICARCPVQAECLDHALEHEEKFGIWGGMGPVKRKKLRKQLRAAS